MSLCRTAAALADQGLSPDQIAARLGIPKRTVHDRLRYARGLRTTRIPADALPALKEHADARALSVAELASALLVAVAKDGLIDAVLDDRPDPNPLKAR
jgi:DNA-binding transcriptional regulator LsrR (DeoR family)